jgi:hypothetical protein
VAPRVRLRAGDLDWAGACEQGSVSGSRSDSEMRYMPVRPKYLIWRFCIQRRIVWM